MKHSIKRQFAIIFIGLMAGSIMLSWFINSTFLEQYYIQNKQKALMLVYTAINEAANDKTINSDEFTSELQSLCGRFNINVLVTDLDSNTIKAYGNDPDNSRMQLWDHLFRPENTPDVKYLIDNKNYQMSIVADRRTQSENIEMWGLLDNGNLFIIRTALESIRESVKIANRFLAYVGLITTLASAMIIWYVSKKVTEPILELASISEKMTRLDFEAKYKGKSHNEIELLGENINRMSQVLETTISELKTANNELMKDIQKKEEIDEMRKEFLSNVSHELKTPIALIQGYAEGLMEGINEDDESRDFYCSVIVDEAGKMNQMVKKLLTLNQLEFGQDNVAMERFDIVTLISNYIQASDILIRQNNITVQLQNEEPIYVWGDEFKIEEVFMNFFSNAINHCGGEKMIEVTYHKTEENVRVVVFNSGEPIPEDSIEHIWEKFYKVDKARTREYGGSGVGLSIVKAIMDSINQHYGVQNYENGVAFWFELETK